MPIRKMPSELPLPALFLWKLQDPGNLGTLIRTAEWFGFRSVIASAGTAECWNPKVVRASMGSVFRLPVFYPDDWINILMRNLNQTVAAAMDGKALKRGTFKTKPCLLLGNEANGLPEKILQLSSLQKVTIPGGKATESLNVSTAGAILMYQLAEDRMLL